MGTREATLPSQPPPRADAPPPRALEDLLALADVRINGPRPWDIQVRNPRLYRRVLAQWSLGLGEAYMDGDWDCEQLDELFHRLLRANLADRASGRARLRLTWEALRHGALNLQSRRRAFEVGQRHYDAGNDVFECMLDSRMVYSCAYWQHAADLEQAQLDKLDMICRKLQLQPGQTLLDIGCGWGALARHAAERYGVQVTGITVSAQQLALARERCAGLPVRLALQDYRELDGRYDAVVSVGMFEHVGPKNYAVYFDTVRRVLDPGGLFLLHTIGVDATCPYTDPWIDRYIFPNGKLPSAVELTRALEGRLLIEDWHNFGPDYDRTLMAWHANFERAWPALSGRYPPRFQRMYRYYLLSCAGFFRSRQGQLWQLVLGGHARREAYRSLRPSGPAAG
jgi:cyclopropane-fatty-acyl-phospholipid synthase